MGPTQLFPDEKKVTFEGIIWHFMGVWGTVIFVPVYANGK